MGITLLQPRHQYMTLPDGWDDAWKAAKAASNASPASIVGIGDSVIAGQGGTDILTDSWWALLRAQLLTTFSLGGDYYSLLHSTSQAAGLSASSRAIAIAGSSGTDWTAYYCGFNRGVDCSTTTLNPFVTFTSPSGTVAIDIIYIDYQAGTPAFKYTVDGGSDVNVTTAGPGTAAGASVKKISITSLAAGVHTIVIKSIGVGNGALILGFTAYKQTGAGLRFANQGWPGMGLVTGTATNNALADTGKFPIDRLSLYQGYQGTTASPSQLTGLGFPAQPDLALIAFGINDIAQGVTVSTFRDNLRKLVQSLRYGKSDACSVVIINNFNGGDGTTSGSSSVRNSEWTGTNYSGSQDFFDAMRQVASEYGCAYVNLHGAFGRTPYANGLTTATNDPHPTVAGHARIATMLGAIL